MGHLAFTNHTMPSVILNSSFFGYGLGYFRRLGVSRNADPRDEMNFAAVTPARPRKKRFGSFLPYIRGCFARARWTFSIHKLSFKGTFHD